MSGTFSIGKRKIGNGEPVYIIAELSANHNQDLEAAISLVRAAKEAGADGVKVQTYTADTMTIDSDKEPFQITGGTLWDGKSLYELYQEAYTPWEWHADLQKEATNLGMGFFSTAFDATAVDFLEKLNVPCHKIASFELVDIPLIEKMAATGKPLIMSTGMGSLNEIELAVKRARAAGVKELLLFKCVSSYPASPEDMNLKTIQHLSEAFGVPVGLSDHTLGVAVPTTSIALGACAIEKHLTLDRNQPGPDSAFSLEPQEFKAMVDAVRISEKAIGEVNYAGTEKEKKSRTFRRSIFAVKNIKAGESFTSENIRVIRPANGLPPRHFKKIIGQVATQDLEAGTPLSWKCVRHKSDET